MKQINANCSGATNPPVLHLDNGHEYTATLESSSRSYWQIPDTETGGSDVLWAGNRGRLTIPPSPGSWEAELPPVSMEPKVLVYVPPAEKITTSGRNFLLNGTRWIWKGSSDFRAYQWYLEGRDLTALYEQRRSAGANLLRVFGMYNGGIGHFVPMDYGEVYYDTIPGFLYEARKHGFQVEWTAFADAQTLTIDQQRHWQHLGAVFQGIPNVFCELANEYKKNGVDPGRFAPIPNVLCSRGSGLSDEAGYLPGWHYHTWHGRRDWPKVLFSAEDMWYVGEGYGWDMQQRPAVHDEPIGFADGDVPGKRSSDPYVARVLAQTSSAYGAGATFHSDYGIQSQLWSPHVEGLARVFFDNLR